MHTLHTYYNILYHRIASLCGNTTGIPLVPSHLDIASHAPASTPAILHQPEVLAIAELVTEYLSGSVSIFTEYLSGSTFAFLSEPAGGA